MGTKPKLTPEEELLLEREAEALKEIPEEQVVRELNLGRGEIRKLRHQFPTQWRVAHARAILWKQGGLWALKDLLAHGAGVVLRASGPGSNHVLADLQRIVLVRPHFVNTRVMHGHVEGEPWDPRQPEIVKVTDSRRFVPGMVVLARQLRGSVWEFEGDPARPEAGKRYPRGIGVW